MLRFFRFRHYAVVCLALFLTLLGAVVAGCGSSSSSWVGGADSASTGPNPGSAPLVAGQQLFGRVLVMPVWFVEEADRQAVLTLRSELEGRGLKVSDHGELVSWPSSPASGWLVQLADQSLVTGPDGGFSLIAPKELGTPGSLTHPTDEGLSPAKFSLGQLRGEAGSPGVLILPMGFHGGCGMSPEDMCGSSPPAGALLPARREAAPIRTKYTPPDYVAGSTQFWGVLHQRLGTYPPPDEDLEKLKKFTCPQFDGPFADGSTDPSGRNYAFSTCDYNAMDGACPNENPLTDVEYAQFVGKLTGTAGIPTNWDAALLAGLHAMNPFHSGEFLTPLSGNGLFDGSCILNHKGRMCGMFLIGDVALDIGDGGVVATGDTGTLKVRPGQSGVITVHNNGVFGITDVRRTSSQAGVTFTSPKLLNHAGLQRLLHFDDQPKVDHLKQHRYQPDRVVNYVVSSSAKPGDKVTYTFTVDNRTVTLIFEIGESSRVNLTPVFKIVKSGDTYQLQASLPDLTDPNLPLKYHWNASGSIGGRLSDANHLPALDFDSTSATVTYTAPTSATDNSTDLIKVQVSLFDASTHSDFPLGSADATVSYVDPLGSYTLDIQWTNKFEGFNLQGDPYNGFVNWFISGRALDLSVDGKRYLGNQDPGVYTGQYIYQDFGISDFGYYFNYAIPPSAWNWVTGQNLGSLNVSATKTSFSTAFDATGQVSVTMTSGLPFGVGGQSGTAPLISEGTPPTDDGLTITLKNTKTGASYVASGPLTLGTKQPDGSFVLDLAPRVKETWSQSLAGPFDSSDVPPYWAGYSVIKRSIFVR